MGVRLEGPEVPGGELLSESPPPGAVQVPAGGAPILLLADRQRSAGYDKPAVIHPDDLPLAGQLQPGERLRFVFVGDHPVPWFRDLAKEFPMTPLPGHLRPRHGRRPRHRPRRRRALRERGRARRRQRHRRRARGRDRGRDRVRRRDRAGARRRRRLARRTSTRMVAELVAAFGPGRRARQQRRAGHLRGHDPPLPRGRPRLVGADHPHQPHERLPVLAGGRDEHGQAPPRGDHPHVERRRHARAPRDGVLRRGQGRDRGADALDGARPRALRRARELRRPGPDPHLRHQRRAGGRARAGRAAAAPRARRTTWPARSSSWPPTTPAT